MCDCVYCIQKYHSIDPSDPDYEIKLRQLSDSLYSQWMVKKTSMGSHMDVESNNES